MSNGASCSPYNSQNQFRLPTNLSLCFRRENSFEVRDLRFGMNEKITTLRDTKPATRLHELDVFRGLAAIAVVYCHFISQCNDLGRVAWDFRWGAYGPHMFFIISGFVIFMTLNRCKRPMDFLFSRFSRLYPLYWIGVILSTVVIVAFHQSSSLISAKQFLVNLTMLQTWLHVEDIEIAYWTLGVELKFYVIMFAVLCFRQTNRIEQWCAFWLAAVALHRSIDLLIGLPKIVATPLILDYAHLFVAGIMFYRMKKEGPSRMRHILIGLAIPMAFLAEGLEVALFSAGFVGIFYLFMFEKLTWIGVRPLRFLGEISYALYLVHGALGYAIIDQMNDWGAPTSVLLTFPVAVVIAVSAALTYYFEQPLLSRMKQWYKRTPAMATESYPKIAPS